jgi:Ni/Co efflux regulator RcnB
MQKETDRETERQRDRDGDRDRDRDRDRQTESYNLKETQIQFVSRIMIPACVPIGLCWQPDASDRREDI